MLACRQLLGRKGCSLDFALQLGADAAVDLYDIGR